MAIIIILILITRSPCANSTPLCQTGTVTPTYIQTFSVCKHGISRHLTSPSSCCCCCCC